MFVSNSLTENKKILDETFKNCGDIVIRTFKAGPD